MRTIYLIITMLAFGFANSQSIGEYKYVVIASKFSAQKKPDQYGLNKLTKLFLEKNGYTAFLDSEIIPDDIAAGSCDKIYVDVIENNNMLVTKLKVVIKDCRNAVLFTSEEGKSSEKEYAIAYNQALRAAFKSFDKPEFRHDPALTQRSIASKNTETTIPVVTSATTTSVTDSGALFAQPIENGFQLVDTTPKIVMKIFKTSQPDVFMISGQNGMVVRKNGQWFHEFYENDKMVSRPLNIKF